MPTYRRTGEKVQPARKARRAPQPMDLNMHQPVPRFAWAGPGCYVLTPGNLIMAARCAQWAKITPIANVGYFGAQPAQGC